MLLRLLAGAGLVALGFYLGKEVGRMQPIREELAKARAQREAGDSARDVDTPTPADDQTEQG
jgi:hypothetical protein